MPQIKIYGLKKTLKPIRATLSDCIHHCVVEVLQFPPEKKFHRFIMLEKENFYYAPDRTDQYLIIELLMMSGRSVEIKKKLIHLLFQEISQQLGISVQDIEICLLESPASHWGFRGKTGDEIALNYSLDV